MSPPRARTWGRIGQTPVVRVRGRGSGRVSMAGMTCYKPGERSRLIYGIREYRGRKGEPKGFGWRDFRDLIVRARIQLGGPIVLVWDNVRLHLTAGMREFIDANADWLNVFQLPAYAPDLNPQEGIWSLVKRDVGNLAAADLGQITRAVKHRLKKIQYQSRTGRWLPRRYRSDPGRLTGKGEPDSHIPIRIVTHRHVVTEGLPEPIVQERGLVENGDQLANLVRRFLPPLLFILPVERETRDHGRDTSVEGGQVSVDVAGRRRLEVGDVHHVAGSHVDADSSE
ncbi:transposase [Streptomyces aureus]|uniref:transposase n=1 Tax=Streptomyces aureus TaxID=193461 RepID=UPI00361C8879